MNYFSRARDIHERAIHRKTTEQDLDAIVAWPEDRLSILFAATDQIRRHFFSDTVEPCAIMNIKAGGCPEDCAFCAQSAHNDARVTVKSLSKPDEILAAAQRARKNELSFGVVSSGRKLSLPQIKKLAEVLEQCDAPLHASLGILTDEEFALLRSAGVTCYNHNLETSRNHFGKIVSTHSYDERVETVRRAKRAGMSVCCGGIFGMGETWEDRKQLCLELRRLGVDTVPLNFLNAIPGTRLRVPAESPLQFLKIVSLFRVGLPDRKIKVCGGREVNLGSLQGLMFFAGANGYISGDYLTTPGDSVESDDRLLEGLSLQKRRGSQT